MFHIDMFVECSTRNVKRKKRRYGIVLQYENKGTIQTREFFRELEGTFNQVMLEAVTDGLGHLKDGCEVTVYQSNDFLTCMIGQNMHVWRENGFRTKKGERIKNQEEWFELSEQLLRHRVKVETVGSHEYSNWLMSEMDKYVDNVDNSEKPHKH